MTGKKFTSTRAWKENQMEKKKKYISLAGSTEHVTVLLAESKIDRCQPP
jgi:hypothetical protein